MAQSNHSVEINVTANAEKAKKSLQEIEALLNKLSRGANLGLGGGGRRGGGSGGGAGGSGGGAGGGADPAFVPFRPKPMYLFRMKQAMRERSIEEKAARDKQRLAKQSILALDKQLKKAEEKRQQIEEKAVKKRKVTQEKLDKEEQRRKVKVYEEGIKAAQKAARDQQRVEEKADRERQKAQERRNRSFARSALSNFEDYLGIKGAERVSRPDEEIDTRIAARKEEEQRRRRRRLLIGAGLLGTGALGVGSAARGTTLTGMGVAGAGDVSQGIGAFGQGLGSIPLLGSVLGAGVDTIVSGIQARLGLQQGLASIQPAAVTARALVPGVGGLGRQLEGARRLAGDLGVGPSQFFQRQAAIAGGTGRGVGPNILRGLIEQSFEEQFLGVDPSSLVSFLRQGTLGRAAGRRGQVRTELGRIESFRQQQGLLPAELTMLRQAGLGFRQQGLAQGFDIQESSLFGLTQGIMGRARSGAGRSLTGAMGLAQRERQLGVGAFQSFAGQFADLPNTLLLAQAAQQGGGVGKILSRLSRLGERPGASAAALRSARRQFGIPTEILQAGISAQLGLSLGAGGDVLRARRQGLDATVPELPEISGVFDDPALGLARAFAGGEVSRLEAGIRFQGEAQLTGLLEANVTMQSSLASMNEDQLPQLIQSVANVQETIAPLVESMNREISDLATKISEALR